MRPPACSEKEKESVRRQTVSHLLVSSEGCQSRFQNWGHQRAGFPRHLDLRRNRKELHPEKQCPNECPRHQARQSAKLIETHRKKRYQIGVATNAGAINYLEFCTSMESMVPWLGRTREPVVNLYLGTFASLHYGTLAPWYHGTIVLATMEQRNIWRHMFWISKEFQSYSVEFNGFRPSRPL